MSIFEKIRTTIFGHRPKAQAPADASPAPAPAPPPPAAPAWQQAAEAASAIVTAQQAKAVDVEQVLLERMEAKGNPKLNYRTSIADLMRLLDLDPSLENRKELATELGYDGPKDGSAEMNIWLHRRVMRELANNGGIVPASLMD